MRVVHNSGKVYDENDKKALQAFLDRGEEFNYGHSYEQFEENLAEYVGKKKAFFVNSGSSANLLALSVFTSAQMKSEWRIRPGNEVITLAASFPTTVFPIVQIGAVPVFIDVDIPTYNVDVNMLDRAYSPKTKGVIFAHTLGNPVNIDAVVYFCKKHDLFLIVDGCDALGSTYKGKSALAYGDISTCSFYAAHNITTGNGGAVFTDDPLLSTLIRSYRSWGRACICPPNKDNVCGHRFEGQFGALPYGYDHKNTFNNFGYNLMATNIQAALGLAQLERIDEFTDIRHRNFDHLYKALDQYDECELVLPRRTEGSCPAWFGFPLLLNQGRRKAFTDFLESRGVQTRYLFAGNIVKQPCFIENTGIPYRIVGELTNTDRVMDDLVWVGVYHGLSISDIDYEAEVIKKALQYA